MKCRKKWTDPVSSWLGMVIFFAVVRRGRFPLREAISYPVKAAQGCPAEDTRGYPAKAASVAGGCSRKTGPHGGFKRGGSIGYFGRAGTFLVAMASAYFAEARIGANMMIMTMWASTIGYVGYLILIDGWPGEFEKTLLISFAIMVLVVWIWNWAAAMLWRRRPGWRKQIRREGYKVPRIMLLMTVATTVAFVCGWKGFVLTFFFALLIGVLPLVCGVVAWPIVAFVIWLPRRQKWKFSELFCATIRSCDAVL